MRQLTEEESKSVFSKLAVYCGRSLNNLVTASDGEGEQYVFRLHGSRVYYLRLSIANWATSVPRANLLSLGVCIGKLTKTGKFRVHITGMFTFMGSHWMVNADRWKHSM